MQGGMSSSTHVTDVDHWKGLRAHLRSQQGQEHSFPASFCLHPSQSLSLTPLFNLMTPEVSQEYVSFLSQTFFFDFSVGGTIY